MCFVYQHTPRGMKKTNCNSHPGRLKKIRNVSQEQARESGGDQEGVPTCFGGVRKLVLSGS